MGGQKLSDVLPHVTVDPDYPSSGFIQTGYGAQHTGFTRAGTAEQGGDAFRGCLERYLQIKIPQTVLQFDLYAAHS